MKSLAKYGANLDYSSPSKQETALMIAAKANNINVVDQLIKCGANPVLKNKKKKTALDMTKNATIKSILTRASSNWDANKKTATDLSVTSTEESGSNQKYVSSTNRGNRQLGGGDGKYNDGSDDNMSSSTCDMSWLNVLNLCKSSPSPETPYKEIDSADTGTMSGKENDRKKRYQSSSAKGTRNDPGNSIGKKIGFYGGTEDNSKNTARSTEKFYHGPTTDDEEDDLTENDTIEDTPYRGNKSTNRDDVESRVLELEEQLKILKEISSKQGEKINALQERIQVGSGYSCSSITSISAVFNALSCVKSSDVSTSGVSSSSSRSADNKGPSPSRKKR